MKKCQVFTPAEYVVSLLDLVGYNNNLYGKSILENSCGDGQILTEIVRRYIEDCLSAQKDIGTIKQGLENDIVAYEIDKTQQIACISSLNRISESYGIKKVRWKIYLSDYLHDSSSMKYDYIVGNPPYITYREIEVSERGYLQKHFNSCNEGKFDYCYAFIEKSLLELKPGGKMSYLVPSSIFKTVFGKNLRKLMLPHITRIHDYKTIQVFESALTSSAIVEFENGTLQSSIYYKDVATSEISTIEKTSLLDQKKWFFGEIKTLSEKQRFGNYFEVKNSVATLYNKAFLIPADKETALPQKDIEAAVLYEAASSKYLRNKKKSFIIFPYQTVEGKVQRIPESTFKEMYPKAYNHLFEYKERLKKRAADDSAAWYEYGRSQSISCVLTPKLLMANIITKEVHIYDLSKKQVPYAGLYIVSKSSSPFDLTVAKEILTSKHFFEYAQKIGTPASGTSVRITSKDVENYLFEKKE